MVRGKGVECSGQFVIIFPNFELRATEKGHCTLMSEEETKCGRSDERLCLRACMPSCVVFSLEGALAAAVRTLCRRPSRKGAPPR